MKKIMLMGFKRKLCFLIFITCSSISALAGDTTEKKLSAGPHLEKRGSATQLIVNGEPFLILGGELHNSSASSSGYMQDVWKKLSTSHLNTVLASVSWELLEPQEGKFDFSLVDDLIIDARKNKMKLVLLWFGSWKNGLSHYTPSWVKKDTRRFPRMRIQNNFPVEAISPLSEEAMKADAKAFAALMKHIKEKDENEQTVIMMQLENEVGLIGDSRDHSALADKLYQQPVPKEMMTYLQKNKAALLPEFSHLWEVQSFRTSGSWKEIFGDNASAEEAFMAWQYARYINQVAESGKSQYSIPMFVNAWIVQPEDKKAGDYPSGGPQAHVHDIWRAAAPSIDLLCPDIYLDEFDRISDMYTRSGNSLFIPESKSGAAGAANAFYAIGAHHAIGYSPFGIENKDVEDLISKAYIVLQQLSPQIVKAQNDESITAVWLNPKKKKSDFNFKNYTVKAALRNSLWRQEAAPENGFAIMIATGADEFIIAGKDVQFNFYPPSRAHGYVGIESIDEGVFANGKWVAGRRLNGDDIMYNYKMADEVALQQNGTIVKLAGNNIQILRVKLYQYE